MIDTFKRNYLLIVVLGIASTWTLGALIISIIESGEFSSFFNSLWWTIVTMTTVGYGDVSPISPLGKIIGAFTAVMGVFQ